MPATAARIDGTKQGGEIRVNTTDVNSDHGPVIMRLSNSNIVVSWVSSRLDEGIRAKIFTPEGAIVSEEFPVNTSVGVHFAPVGAELDDSGFVIGWQGGPGIGRTFARFRMFQPNGKPSGPETVPNIVGFHDEMAMTAGNQNCPCVATLLDEQGESVVVAWIDDSVSGSGSALRAVKARSLSGSLGPV